MINNKENISNIFTDTNTENLEKDLGTVMKLNSKSIFGVELSLREGVADKLLVTPPHIRVREGNQFERHRETCTDDFTFYEGYLSRPFFLPLYHDLNGEFVDEVNNLTEYLEDNEQIYMQWLFRKSTDWSENAIDMYQSYRYGNDYPFTFRFGRLVQDKVLNVLNKISNFKTDQELNYEAESKILSEGYQFQLRVGIKAEPKRQKTLKEGVEYILQGYDSYNAIRLSKQNNKKGQVTHYLNNCILAYDSEKQILSEFEIKSLFGGNTEPKPYLEDEEIPQVSSPVPVVENKTSILSKGESKGQGNVSDVIKLLPEYPREEVTAKEGLTTEIAESLKRVGLIKTARLYNESVTAGIRLTVVQCDIPKGKNLSHISKKSEDIQAALGVPSLSIAQGTEPDTVSFTIPNEEPAMISLRELVEQEEFQKFHNENPLAFPVGVDEINNPIYLSLSELVHLMVAGTTGSGKSVFINSLATTLLTHYSPEELNMYMIDPKFVELQHYKNFPHVKEVITDMDKATSTLKQITQEMDDRYKRLSELGVNHIQLYNQKAEDIMPYIVFIVDEYADLKDTNPDVEDFISRIGQKARACGIHMVIATQRPSTDIISGRVKAVIPNAISFNLNSSVDYKTVFGTKPPITNLLGKGDGIMKITGYPKEFQRFQSAIISPDEAEEGEVYKQLVSYFNGEEMVIPEKQEKQSRSQIEIENVSSPPQHIDYESETDDLIYRLKQTIANTGETKTALLREFLGVKSNTMKELMNHLVDEGWLIKHKARSKGYEIIVSEDVLDEWRGYD